VTPPTPSGGDAAACARLAVEVPSRLEGHRIRVTSPKSPRVFAWGDPPILLRCGVARPAGYDPAGSVTVINGVDWWQRLDGRVVRWTVVGRAAYAELAVPTSYAEQGVFLVDLAEPVKRALPVVAGR
jgi:hypothetical protein